MSEDHREDMDALLNKKLQLFIEQECMNIPVGQVVSISNYTYDSFRELITRQVGPTRQSVPYIQWEPNCLILMGVRIYPIRYFRKTESKKWWQFW